MTEQHPITPPPELIQELAKSAGYKVPPGWLTYALEKVFQAGADQELEACCGWVHRYASLGKELRAARRPKPLSLKEQALEGLTRIESTNDFFSNQMKDLATIRRALEALSDD